MGIIVVYVFVVQMAITLLSAVINSQYKQKNKEDSFSTYMEY